MEFLISNNRIFAIAHIFCYLASKQSFSRHMSDFRMCHCPQQSQIFVWPPFPKEVANTKHLVHWKISARLCVRKSVKVCGRFSVKIIIDFQKNIFTLQTKKIGLECFRSDFLITTEVDFELCVPSTIRQLDLIPNSAIAWQNWTSKNVFPLKLFCSVA